MEQFVLLTNYWVDQMTMRMKGHIACMEKIRNSYSVSVGKSEGKSLLGRLKQ
jgi:hypothetical protein